MNHKWLEGVGRTFYQSFFAFNKIKHIDGGTRIMRHFFGEPMPPGFNKFRFMQARPFFAYTIFLVQQLRLPAGPSHRVEAVLEPDHPARTALYGPVDDEWL